MPHEDAHAKPDQMLDAWLDWGLGQAQDEELRRQLVGGTHERLATETPWPLAGGTHERQGDTYERLAGDTLQHQGGETPWPLVGETPQQLVGDTHDRLAGDTSERLAGGTPWPVAGERLHQQAGDTPWPVAGERLHQQAGETPWPVAGDTSERLAGGTPWPLVEEHLQQQAGETEQHLVGETHERQTGETPWPVVGDTHERLAGDAPQQLVGETTGQLTGDMLQHQVGETPWPLVGENPHQLVGDTPERLETPEELAGENPHQLVGETPERLETPEELAGENLQQLVGDTPERLETPERLVEKTPEELAVENLQQLVGETLEQLARETPQQSAEPLAEQEDPRKSDGDCEVVWTSGPQESTKQPYRTAESRRSPYATRPDPSKRSLYVSPDYRRSVAEPKRSPYSIPNSRQTAAGRGNQRQNARGWVQPTPGRGNGMGSARGWGQPTKQNVLDAEPPFCFRCEQLFPSRTWLEEHACPAMTYICSCGTEFSAYMDMVQHSREHKPGQAVLDHATIRKRRVEMQNRDQLRWMKQSPLPQVSVRPPSIAISPWSTSPGKVQLPPPPVTVGLWALYQPVVLIDTMRRFNKANPYQCATCDQSFATKNALVRHHSAHLNEKVAGCLRCGMLLPTKRGVPKPHHCRTSNGALMSRINAPPPKATVVPPRATAVSLGKITLPRRAPMVQPAPPTAHSLYKQQVPVMTAPPPPDPSLGSFRCNMCYVTFQSVKVLQKHKCPIAMDYVRRRQALMPSNQKRVTINKVTTGLFASPQNNSTELKVNIQAFRDIQAHHQKVAVMPARASAVPAIRVNAEVDSDDDCIMIES